MSVYDPAYREHPRPIQEQQILVLVLLRYSNYLSQVVVNTKSLDHPDRLSLALRHQAQYRPKHSQQNQRQYQSNYHIVAPIHLRNGLLRVINLQINKRHHSTIRNVLKPLIEVILYPLRIFIRCDLLCTLVGCTQSDVLSSTGQSVKHADRKIGIFVLVVDTVVIVPQVVQKFARVRIHDSG
jgi:hypothetical protein